MRDQEATQRSLESAIESSRSALDLSIKLGEDLDEEVAKQQEYTERLERFNQILDGFVRDIQKGESKEV